jgi:hypothetical protein
MMLMKKFRTAKLLVPSAAALMPPLFGRRGASRNLHFLCCAAGVSCRARRVTGRKNHSEQTIYDAATRQVLQIELRWLESDVFDVTPSRSTVLRFFR